MAGLGIDTFSLEVMAESAGSSAKQGRSGGRPRIQARDLSHRRTAESLTYCVVTLLDQSQLQQNDRDPLGRQLLWSPPK